LHFKNKETDKTEAYHANLNFFAYFKAKIEIFFLSNLYFNSARFMPLAAA